MTEDEFTETLVPIKNHLDDNAAWDGCMFETFGLELDFILKTHHKTPNLVWTIVEDDYGNPCIVEGYHLVNRLGFLVVRNAVARASGAARTSGSAQIIVVEDL